MTACIKTPTPIATKSKKLPNEIKCTLIFDRKEKRRGKDREVIDEDGIKNYGYFERHEAKEDE